MDELFNRYKEYDPIITYISVFSYEHVYKDYSVGWHCSIRIEPYSKNETLEEKMENEMIHVNGFNSPTDALNAALNVLKDLKK